MGPLGSTDMKYRRHNTEIWSFIQFLPETGNFLPNRGLTPMNFEQKIVYFLKPVKTHIWDH
jgi:hypothetical protein